MKLETAINNAKKKLIKKAQNNGLYENFGQKEVSNLADKFLETSDYTKDMSENRKLIEVFDNWCMNYDGR